MKIAEALLLRSEYQKRIESLKSRILVNIKVQEGDKPHEDPKELLKEIFDVEETLNELVIKINHKNLSTKLPNGDILADLIAKRDMIMKKRKILTSIINEANKVDYRLTHSEIKMTMSLDIAQTQKQIDKLSKEYRELDTQIQSINWTTDF
jgi:hypothetical protein